MSNIMVARRIPMLAASAFRSRGLLHISFPARPSASVSTLFDEVGVGNGMTKTTRTTVRAFAAKSRKNVDKDRDTDIDTTKDPAAKILTGSGTEKISIKDLSTHDLQTALKFRNVDVSACFDKDSLRKRLVKLSSAPCAPQTSISTPSGPLRTQPSKSSSRARRQTKGRKPTPCTSPRTRNRTPLRAASGPAAP